MSKLKTILLLVICRLVWLAAFIIFLGAAFITIITLLEEVSILTRIREALLPGFVAICTLTISVVGIRYENELKKTL